MDIAIFLVTFMENKTYLSTYESRIYDLKKDLAEKEHQLVEQQQVIKKLQKDLGVATTTQGQIVQFLNQAIEAQQKAQQQTQAPQATPEIKK